MISKKKKIVKNKKNVIINKKNNKRKVKKRTKKRIAKATTDNIYHIVNKIQISQRKKAIVTSLNDHLIIENIIKDGSLPYEKKVTKTKVIFLIYPNKSLFEDDLLKLEIYDDEIPEEGQIFG